MKWKAVTPNFSVSESLTAIIEKIEDGKFYIVRFSLGDKVKERLFKSEAEADNFISYLTNDNF